MARFVAGDKVKSRGFVVTTDSDRLGYPETYIRTGAIGVVTSGPNPFVDRAGTFYKVKFDAGHVAMRPAELRKA